MAVDCSYNTAYPTEQAAVSACAGMGDLCGAVLKDRDGRGAVYRVCKPGPTVRAPHQPSPYGGGTRALPWPFTYPERAQPSNAVRRRHRGAVSSLVSSSQWRLTRPLRRRATVRVKEGWCGAL